MKKYICYGGEVISRHDGDRHYIDPQRIADLYHVPSEECIFVRDMTDERHTLSGLDMAEYIHLYPDFNGKYEVPEKNNLKDV